MKVVTIFSGKGGVGKSTVSSLLAMALSKNHKTALLDLDINTPSIPVMFGGQKKVGNLELFSLGYKTQNPITFTGKVVRKALMDLANEVKRAKPDVCIVDMPPGTGDVQLEVATKLKPSAYILVVQPNNLSKEDGIRATQIFMTTNVPVIGMIENMTGAVFGRTKSIQILKLPVLHSLKLNKEIARAGNEGKMGEIAVNPFDKKAEELLKKATDIDWIEIKKPLIMGLDAEALMEAGVIDQQKKSTLKFYGLESWEHVREALLDMEYRFTNTPDNFLELNTREIIEKMLIGLGEDNIGMFMITNNPNTEIETYPGEVGMGTLFTSATSYYGIPRLKYQTDQGDVVLFPNEVIPIDTNYLMELVDDGELMLVPNSKTPRYVPTPRLMKILENSFGTRVGLPKDWRQEYKEFGIEVEAQ